MAKRRKTSEKTDRHTVKMMGVRLHPMLRHQLEALAEKNASNITEEVRIAVREKLERSGLWPPSDEVRSQFTD